MGGNGTSVGTISLDLEVNTQISEQLEKAKKSADTISQKLGESVEQKISQPFQNAESQITKFSETMREKLGHSFEISSNPAEKLQQEIDNAYEKLELLQRKWCELTSAESSDKIDSQLNATERQIMSTEQQLAKLEARFAEMNQTNLGQIDSQLGEIFERLKKFEVPKTPVQALEAELQLTASKLDLLQKKWQELSNSEPSDKTAEQMIRIQQQIISTSETSERLKNRLAEMNRINLEQAENQIAEVGQSAEQTGENLKRALRFEVPKSPVKQLRIELDIAKQKLEILQQKWRELSSAEPTEQVRSQLVQIEQQIISTQHTIDGLNRKIRESSTLIGSGIKKVCGTIYSNLKNYIKNPLYIVRDTAESTFSSIKKVGSKAFNMLKSIGGNALDSLKSKFSFLSKSAVSLTKPIRKLGRMLKNTFRRVFIMATLYAAVKGIKNAINSVLKANKQLSDSLNEVKANLAVAFTPILISALPSINGLMSGLTRLTKQIAGFTASLFKMTYSQAAEAAKKLKDTARTAENTAKKVKMSMAGIDEMNVLSDGSSDDSEEDSGIDFSKLDLSEPEIPDWAERLKTAIKSGDWYSVGKIFAERVNSIFDSVDWEKIEAKIRGKSDKICDLINGFFDSLDWKSLGSSLAGGINTVTAVINTFAYKIHWESIGKSLANSLNSAISNVNWNNLGKALSAKIKILTDLIYGFVTQFNWISLGNGIGEAVNGWFENIDFEKLGKTVSVGIKGILDTISTIVQTIDFNVISEKIGSFLNNIDTAGILNRAVNLISGLINKIFDSLDWQSLGKFLSDGINAVVSAWNTLSNKIKWKSIGKSLAKGLNSVIFNVNWNNLGKALSAKIKILTDLIYGFVTEFDWISLGNGIGEAVNGWFDNIDFGKIAVTLSEGIKGIFDTASAVLSTVNFGNIGGKLAEFVNNIDIVGILSKFAKLLSDLIKSVLDFAAEFFENVDWSQLGDNIFDSFVGIVENIDWKAILSKAFELFGAVIGGASMLFGSILLKAWEVLKTAWNSVKEHFNQKIEECGENVIKGVFTGILDGLRNIGKWIMENIFQPFIDGFKKAFGIHSPSKEMAVMGSYIIEGLLNAVSDGITEVKRIFEEMLQKIKEVFSGIGEWFSDKFKSAYNAVKSAFSGIGNWFAEKWSDITVAFSEVGTWFHNKFSEAWSNIVQIFSSIVGWFGEKWNGIKSVFSAVSDSFKNWFGMAWENVKNAFRNPKEFFNGVWNAIKSCFSRVTDWFRDTFSEAWTAVKNVFSKGGEIFTGITDGIADTFKTVVNGLIDGFNRVIAVPFRAISEALNGLKSWELWTPWGDFYPFEWFPEISTPEIPHLAKGGIATAPTLAMVGDNKNAVSDPEVISPLSKLRGMLGSESAETVAVLNAILALLKGGISAEFDGSPFGNDFRKTVLRIVADDKTRRGG